jgi:hypothetical protein
MRYLVECITLARGSLVDIVNSDPEIFKSREHLREGLFQGSLDAMQVRSILAWCAPRLNRSISDLELDMPPRQRLELLAAAAGDRDSAADEAEDLLEWFLDRVCNNAEVEAAHRLAEIDTPKAAVLLASLAERDDGAAMAQLVLISDTSVVRAYELLDSLIALEPDLAEKVQTVPRIHGLPPRPAPQTTEVEVAPIPLRDRDPIIGKAQRLANLIRHGDIHQAIAEILASVTVVGAAKYRIKDARALVLAIGHTGPDGSDLMGRIFSALLNLEQPAPALLTRLLSVDMAVVDTALEGLPVETGRRLLYGLIRHEATSDALRRSTAAFQNAGTLAVMLRDAMFVYGGGFSAARVLEIVPDLAALLRQLLEVKRETAAEILGNALVAWEQQAEALVDSRPGLAFVEASRALNEPHVSALGQVLAALISTNPVAAATLLFLLGMDDPPNLGALILAKAIDHENRVGEAITALTNDEMRIPPALQVFERLAEQWANETRLLVTGLVYTAPTDAKKIASASASVAPKFTQAIIEQMAVMDPRGGWDYVIHALEVGDYDGARAAIELHIAQVAAGAGLLSA